MIGLILVLILKAASQEVAPPGNTSNPGLCNFAKVYRLRDGSRLSVRSGSGASFSLTDRLEDGRSVYICDEHRDWYRIYYGGLDTPCGQEFPAGIDARKASECKSGWVSRKWIDVHSG
jgi:hypothetical protein